MHEIDVERAAAGVEITCKDRFERTLARLGIRSRNGAGDVAEELRRKHMASVRAVTRAPEEHKEVVRRIARSYRLGLLSNFDDASTGREIVADTGVGDLFEVVVISAEVALRKPNPKIFRHLLDALALEPSQVLFVGDTFREDVVGAQACGIPVAWLSEGKAPMPEGAEPPDFVLTDLTALPTILDLA